MKRSTHTVKKQDGLIHRPEKARFTVREEKGDVIVSCAYWEVRHSRNRGGNISSVIFPHGSGMNIFAAPFCTQIRTGNAFNFDGFENTFDEYPALTCHTDKELLRVQSRSALINRHGAKLPVTCDHSYTYHPWGYISQTVTLTLHQSIPDAWNIGVARPVAAGHLDEFAYRPSPENSTDWRNLCKAGSWFKLDRGNSFRDFQAIETGEIPLYLMFLRRGVEGFDWFCGENLDQWHAQISDVPHLSKFRVGYNEKFDGYEIMLSPLDKWADSMELKGTYTFDFFMGLPFVQEYVRPMFRGGGVSYGYNLDGGNQTRKDFLNDKEIRRMADHKVQILRHHDDGPQPDGVFWRDGGYPPYPAPIMNKLDTCISGLHDFGIHITPYFSLHEWHPDTNQFREKAPACKRTTQGSSKMLHNPAPLGEYGGQMCLASEWEEILRKNIDRVLKNHAFDGVYYDWTLPLPCYNKQHHPYTHWDIEEFIRVLEWSRERVGGDGMLYLHMSLEPFIVAENMATCVLVYESPHPPRPTNDMFPPIAEFMKTCPHFVLSTPAQISDPKRFLLYSLLSHVTVDNPSQEFLSAYKVISKINFTKYKKFSGYLQSPVPVSSREVLSALYWNENEALVLLANFSDKTVRCTWRIDSGKIGWKSDGYRITGTPDTSLAPLSYRYISIMRQKNGAIRALPNGAKKKR
jgi:hypothetical protein